VTYVTVCVTRTLHTAHCTLYLLHVETVIFHVILLHTSPKDVRRNVVLQNLILHCQAVPDFQHAELAQAVPIYMHPQVQDRVAAAAAIHKHQHISFFYRNTERIILKVLNNQHQTDCLCECVCECEIE
jgi:hypothetical protein